MRSENTIMAAFDSQWSQHFKNLEAQVDRAAQYDILPMFLKYLPKNGTILEAGCGSGRWLFYFSRNGYNIVGIDWSKETVKCIREYDPTITAYQGDCGATTFPDDYFETILSLGTYEHDSEGPQKSLIESHRILKTNGIIDYYDAPFVNGYPS